MGDVTRILADIEQGDPRAAEKLLPLVYDELRRLAAGFMRGERPGQTLQATALVHEAYMRLAGAGTPWHDKQHFKNKLQEFLTLNYRVLVQVLLPDN